MSKKPLDDPKIGIHRAKTWEIGFFALNNLSTNLYLMTFSMITYFLNGFLGVGVVLAGSITTVLRMWDGVTDPFIGMILDKTNGKFGKNRPFILLGNIILFVFSGLIFMVLPNLPMPLRFPGYVVLYMIYIIGYTFQCCVTKSAQTCLTNDPEQRPVYSMFNMVYAVLMSMIYPLWLTDVLLPKYGMGAYGDISFFQEIWFVLACLSAVFAVLAIVGLWRKDNPKYFGTGVIQKIGFKDYWDVLKNNRALQMMIVATSTDKLALTVVGNPSVGIIIYAIATGNVLNTSRISAITTIPRIIFSLLLIQFIARKMGQKKAMVVGTWGGIIGCMGILALYLFGDPTTMDLTFSNGISFFSVAFLVFYMIWQSCSGVTGDIGITMTADCADYEVYRTGKYVPGLMGTLFSFVDKMISSLAGTLVVLLLAAIGFKETLPNLETPNSPELMAVGLFCFVGAPVIGYLCNIVAMKFYPLTKEKMAEIQAAIADIKAQAAK